MTLDLHCKYPHWQNWSIFHWDEKCNFSLFYAEVASELQNWRKPQLQLWRRKYILLHAQKQFEFVTWSVFKAKKKKIDRVFLCAKTIFLFQSGFPLIWAMNGRRVISDFGHENIVVSLQITRDFVGVFVSTSTTPSLSSTQKQWDFVVSVNFNSTFIPITFRFLPPPTRE